MSKILEIVELGNPLLREKAKPVENLSDPFIQELIDDMICTCANSNAVGISAPQVGHSLRLFIVASCPTPAYPNTPTIEPMVIINPLIVSHSGEYDVGWEGCLSIPGLRGKVSRRKYVEAKFVRRDGEVDQLHFYDFVGRIFQHEFDHLEGVMFIDPLRSDPESFATAKEYNKLMDIQ